MKQPDRPNRPTPPPAQRAQQQAFVAGVIAEMRRVTWPSREEWIGATILTVALVVGVGVFTWAADLAFGWIISFLSGTPNR